MLFWRIQWFSAFTPQMMMFSSEVPRKVTENARSYVFSVKCLCFRWKMQRDHEPKKPESSLARNAPIPGTARQHRRPSIARAPAAAGRCPPEAATPRDLALCRGGALRDGPHRAPCHPRDAASPAPCCQKSSRVGLKSFLARHPAPPEGECRECS